MDRRSFVRDPFVGLGGLSGIVAAVRNGMTAVVDQLTGTPLAGVENPSISQAAKRLFPTDLTAREWRQFPAAGFSRPACGVIYRHQQPPEEGVP